MEQNCKHVICKNNIKNIKPNNYNIKKTQNSKQVPLYKSNNNNLKNPVYVDYGQCYKCGKFHFNCFCCEDPNGCPIHGNNNFL